MKTVLLAVVLCGLVVASCCGPWCKPPTRCNFEDCLGLDPMEARAEQANGSWRIVAGGSIMLDFGDKQDEAERAIEIIRHYKLDEQCFVGRPNPPMRYWKVKGEAPSGAMPGEDCISFNPDNIAVENGSGDWKIVADGHIILNFGDQEHEARTSLKIIKCYGFTSTCYVGRPDASMVYFRK
ncbi:MAG: hypothetical protein OEV49_15170 [candidate division Zixibacteria bacterium]|nr:hypothetical protein [candidate division Zixibacteria bacterium]MDH3936049.1 hypothetical protein [candidate division Zixibacteria bacterium]MDH4035204.1 hypothetical protein [candidate division Zixibacteria bacterium]